MADPFTVCPECGKRDGTISMPFVIFGFCDGHKLIWEMEAKADGAPVPDDQKKDEWKVWGGKQYSRVGPQAPKPDGPRQLVAPPRKITDVRPDADNRVGAKAEVATSGQKRISGPIKDPSQPEVVIDEAKGIAYQRDRTRSIPYGVNYFAEYQKRAGTDIARKLNAARMAVTERYCTKLLDVGIGSGEFIESSRLQTIGYDVNRVAVEWLTKRGIFVDPYSDGIPDDVDGVCLWDVLEHVPEPSGLLKLVPTGCYLFVSLPIFDDLKKVKQSRHFKPDEHYWYFTESGLLHFMEEHGFQCIEVNDDETKSGRDGIKTFVFRRRTISAAKPKPSSWEPGARICTVDDFGGWTKAMHFIVPAGIGDISWIYSKVRHLKIIHGFEVILSVAGDLPRRSEPFVKLLPDVHWGGYVDGVESWDVLSQSLPGDWPVKMGTREFLHKPKRQNLAANLHLESGRPLASWLSWLPTDYHYPLAIPNADCVEAQSLLAPLPPVRIAVYVSNRDKERFINGGWDLWRSEQWAWFLRSVANLSYLKGKLGYVVLGADFDRDKSEEVAGLLDASDIPTARVIGHRLGVALSAMRSCRYSFCYPSGIGVLSNVLGVPGLMLLPWLLSGLSEAFADPHDIAVNRFKAWPDAKPEEAFEWFAKTASAIAFHDLRLP